MNLELNDEERLVIRHALEVYLSDLREEVTKTEKHDFKVPLTQGRRYLKKSY